MFQGMAFERIFFLPYASCLYSNLEDIKIQNKFIYLFLFYIIYPNIFIQKSTSMYKRTHKRTISISQMTALRARECDDARAVMSLIEDA